MIYCRQLSLDTKPRENSSNFETRIRIPSNSIPMGWHPIHPILAPRCYIHPQMALSYFLFCAPVNGLGWDWKVCVYPISSLKVSTAFTLYSQVTDPRLPGTLDPRTKTCCNWNILTFIKFQDLFHVIQISQKSEFLGLQTDSSILLVVGTGGRKRR